MASHVELEGRQTVEILPAEAGQEGREFSIIHRRGPWRDALRRRMLAAADVVGVVAALLVAAALGTGSARWLLWTPAILPLWPLLAKLQGLYDRDHRALRHLTADEFPSLVTWAAAGTVATMFVLSLTSAGAPSAAGGVRIWVGTIIIVPVLRASARALWRRITPPERVLVMGSGPLEQATKRKLELFGDMHLELVGTIDDRAKQDTEIGVLVARATRGRPIERLILATQAVDENLIAELVAFCRARWVKLSIVPPARGMFGTAVELNHVADLPMMAYNTWDVPRSTLFLKRVIDVGFSAVALVVLAPLMAVIAVLIRLDGGPSLFVQRRGGVEGSPFRMFKFRTMTRDAESRLSEVVRFEELREPVFKHRHDPRVTPVGRWLRRWSLDELPQLINVLRGDMSLVGPRPEQVELIELYQPEQRIRLAVKPGLTGPMQVFGRGDLGFDERLAVERDYVENISLRRDLRILLMTVSPVLRGRGAF